MKKILYLLGISILSLLGGALMFFSNVELLGQLIFYVILLILITEIYYGLFMKYHNIKKEKFDVLENKTVALMLAGIHSIILYFVGYNIMKVINFLKKITFEILPTLKILFLIFGILTLIVLLGYTWFKLNKTWAQYNLGEDNVN